MGPLNLEDIWVQLPIYINPFTGMAKVRVKEKDLFVSNEHNKILQIVKDTLEGTPSAMKNFLKEEFGDDSLSD